MKMAATAALAQKPMSWPTLEDLLLSVGNIIEGTDGPGDFFAEAMLETVAKRAFDPNIAAFLPVRPLRGGQPPAGGVLLVSAPHTETHSDATKEDARAGLEAFTKDHVLSKEEPLAGGTPC